MIQIGKTKKIVKIQIRIDLLLCQSSSPILNLDPSLQKNLQDYYTQTHGNLINHSLKKKEVKNLNMYLMHMKP